MWYAAVAADVLGVSLGEVMQRNVDKLMKRYPNGFSTEDSVARVDVKEA
jgi:NTP pyrophosphatase (non-canonical NTP hydrolase)